MQDYRLIEQTLISTLMWGSAGSFLEHARELREDDFSDGACRAVFGVLRERAMEGKPLDDINMIVLRLKELSRGEVAEAALLDIAAVTPTMDIAGYVSAVRNGARRLRLKGLLTQLVAGCDDPATDIDAVVAKAFGALSADGRVAPASTLCMTDVMELLRQRVADNAAGRGAEGFLTGFDRLDRYGGLHPGDLVIVAGWSSHGKTALALNMIYRAASLSDARVLVFSMEMDALQVGARLLSPLSGVPANVIMYRPMKEKGQSQVATGLDRIASVAGRIFIGDGSIQTVDAILGCIRLHHVRHSVRLVMIDYVQIIDTVVSRDSSREQALADVARRLKNLAKELGICVVLLSQINREGYSGGFPEPSASQLRGSGQINEAADLTLIVYRPEVLGIQYRAPNTSVPTEGTAMLKIEKDRNGGYGGVGSFIVCFDGPTTSFTDADPKML